jgi:ribosome biogenesis GTPase
MSIDLSLLGYDDRWAAALPAPDAGLPGRVAREDRSAYQVLTADGGCRATLAPALRRACDPVDRPAVGDWVCLGPGEPPVITAVLPRRTAFVRHVAGDVTSAQVLAANVDVVLLVVALDRPPHLRRLERLLTLAWESGAQPVVLLSKSDCCSDLALLEARTEVERVSLGVDVHAVSAVSGEGLDDLAPYVGPGRTVALLGVSGAGKSTLANALAGAELLATSAIRSDGKGRHTTTHRELVTLPTGGVLIDTPGMRGVQLWAAEDGLAAAFDDVERLTGECRFSDCGHDTEPGCAVHAAINAGTLDARRLDSHRKLQRELHHLAAKADARLRAEDARKRRVMGRALRAQPWRP